MASIFSAAKSMISKITDDLNKDKWDKNCINTALFTDPEPGKMVPPNRNSSGDGDGANAAAAAAPAEVEKAAPEPAPAAPIVAPAPQIDYGKSEPQVKQNTAAPEEPKKEPVRFVNPRFSRAMPYVTSKVKKPEDGLRSLSDLPVVDPSQSISNIAEVRNPGEETEPAQTEAAAPAAETVMPVTAEAAAPAAAEAAAPVTATAVEAAAPAAPEPAAPAAATAVEAAPEPAAPAAATAVEATPEPAAPATVETAAAPVAVPEYNPAPVAAEEAPAAAEEEEKCYYVLITHRKIYPEKGSRIMMRNCDSQYAWTDSVDESKKPTFPTCPVCGKTIEYIETEMD